MKTVEDKSCYKDQDPIREFSSNITQSFEFQNGYGVKRCSNQRRALGKPTPSKWDDAQKWLVGCSRGGEKNQSKTTPRNSNADDLRLIAPPVPIKDEDDENVCSVSESDTKKIDYAVSDSVWRVNKQVENTICVSPIVRSICVRDMGTEMTPSASLEPSRTTTPIRATTPVLQSPISSGSSTPARYTYNQGNQTAETCEMGVKLNDSRVEQNANQCSETEESNQTKITAENDEERKMNTLESRAMAWDEAERAKFMARFKREEVKIQAWENREKRKAEMEMRKTEVKAERMKARAEEKMANKVAASRRMAEEKRANAEAKLNEKAVRTSERSDYVRRTGHLPSAFSFKLPSLCW